MSDTRLQARSRSWFWWNLCLSCKIRLVQNFYINQHHSRTANSSHERCYRFSLWIARRRRLCYTITHVRIRKKWRRHSRMQAEKSFVWSEASINNVIRYHTQISDWSEILRIKFWSCSIYWFAYENFSSHVCKWFAAIQSQFEWFTRYLESTKTTIQDDEFETIVSLSWHKNNHQSE
jgi:hypothetical protein